MATVYLGLGSNVEPARHLRLAVAELARRFSGMRISAVYRNAPVGFEGDDFLNLVAEVETELRPAGVLRELEAIHCLAGRRPREGLSSRELDIDLLLYDRLVSGGDGPNGGASEIVLPRRDVLAYDFVLRPLAELAPDYVHPVTNRRLADHWSEMAPAGRPMQRETLTL